MFFALLIFFFPFLLLDSYMRMHFLMSFLIVLNVSDRKRMVQTRHFILLSIHIVVVGFGGFFWCAYMYQQCHILQLNHLKQS